MSDPARRLALALRAPDHRQPINPKAVYRTRDVALFEEAASLIERQATLLSRLEWIGEAVVGLACCPLCSQKMDDGHSGDCGFAVLGVTTASPPADDAGVAANLQAGELTADFPRALPGGKLDDSAFEEIEFALDMADAASQAEDGRWLSLAERVASLSARLAKAEAR